MDKVYKVPIRSILNLEFLKQLNYGSDTQAKESSRLKICQKMCIYFRMYYRIYDMW